MLDLERLRLFVAIVDQGSLTAASREVALSQPAASRSLQVLEERVGADLFDRVGRGLVLTSVGRALEPRARRLLAQAEAAEVELRRVARRRYFDLRIGTVDSVATYLLGSIVEPLRGAFPSLVLKLRTARTMALLEQLETEALDLAVVAWSGAPPVERAYRVGPYRMRYYGRADRFDDIASISEEAALTRHPIVEIESLSGQPTLIPEDAEAYAVGGSLASVKSLVLAGFGVGALLDFMLSPEERAELVAAAVPHDPACGVFVAVSPGWRGEAQDAITEVVVEALRGRLAVTGCAVAS